MQSSTYPQHSLAARIPLRGRFLQLSLFGNVLLLVLLLHAFSSSLPVPIRQAFYSLDSQSALEPSPDAASPPSFLNSDPIDSSPFDGTVHLPNTHLDTAFVDSPPSSVPAAGVGEIAIADGKGRMVTRNCRKCSPADEFCEEFGEHNIARSVLYEGTNHRLRRLLWKLRRGEPITVGAIGGSVSAGQGIGGRDDKILHRQIFDHINETFPHKDHVFVNGAVPARGSGYFQYCFKEHIPEETDLVLLELGVNDQRLTQSLDHYEVLIRGLLELPNNPAILNLQVFGLQYESLSIGADMHYGPASYYDIPTLSMRNFLLPQILQDPERRKFYFSANDYDPGGYDLAHMGRNGHDVMAKIANLYIDRQICEMDRIESEGVSEQRQSGKWHFLREDDVDVIPRLRLMSKWSVDGVVPKIQSTCLSTSSVKHPLEIYQTEGWSFWRDSFKKKPYIATNTTGSTVSFKFTTSLGQLKLSYLKSASFGLGIVDCWVDDNKNQIRSFSGYTTDKINIPHTNDVSNSLTPGNHILNCVLTDRTDDPNGGHGFRITAIMGL